MTQRRNVVITTRLEDDTYQYNAGKTLFQCQQPTVVLEPTAHQRQDMSVNFRPSLEIVSPEWMFAYPHIPNSQGLTRI